MAENQFIPNGIESAEKEKKNITMINRRKLPFLNVERKAIFSFSPF